MPNSRILNWSNIRSTRRTICNCCICGQNSWIGSQIAHLTADIILKKTNAYHGTTVNIHKISVEPIYTRKVSQPKPNALLQKPVFATS